MRCPKCSYISFDSQENCRKCGRNLAEVTNNLNGTIYLVTPPPFLAMALAAMSSHGDEDSETFLFEATEAEGGEQEFAVEESGESESYELEFEGPELESETDSSEIEFSMPDQPAPEPESAEFELELPEQSAPEPESAELELELPEQPAPEPESAELELELPDQPAPESEGAEFELELPDQPASEPESAELGLELPDQPASESEGAEFELELPEQSAPEPESAELELELSDQPAPESEGAEFELELPEQPAPESESAELELELSDQPASEPEGAEFELELPEQPTPESEILDEPEFELPEPSAREPEGVKLEVKDQAVLDSELEAAESAASELQPNEFDFRTSESGPVEYEILEPGDFVFDQEKGGETTQPIDLDKLEASLDTESRAATAENTVSSSSSDDAPVQAQEPGVESEAEHIDVTEELDLVDAVEHDVADMMDVAEKAGPVSKNQESAVDFSALTDLTDLTVPTSQRESTEPGERKPQGNRVYEDVLGLLRSTDQSS